MRSAEEGFLLLTSHLGDMQSKPLTVAGFRVLINRVRGSERCDESRELELQDLLSLGYDRKSGENILFLLSRTEQLKYYVNRGKHHDCHPLTRASEEYPGKIRIRLGADCPGCLWTMGDLSLLQKPMISLVGSRELASENYAFARETGRQAALQGYVLVSGNARGADRAAQDSCLEHGGQVISIVADSMMDLGVRSGVLYISEDGYDCGFTSARALSRNRLIHAMGKCTLVAQCSHGKGGTWNGCCQNLQHGYSPVFCFQDGSPGASELVAMGANFVDIFDLSNLENLQPSAMTMFEI